MTFEEMTDVCKTIFGKVSAPFALADADLKVQWANDEARGRLPALTMPNGLEEYLAADDTTDVLKQLNQGRPFCAYAANDPLNRSRLMIYPVVDGGLVGCLVMFDSGDDGRDQDNIVKAFADSYRLPLTIIFSTLGLMSRGLTDDDTVMKTYIKLISQNCYRLLRMANNMSESVRFISGTAGMKMRNGDLTAFVSGLCGAASVMTASIDIPLKAEMPNESIMTAFDSEKLSSAILNLISNACKYTRAGNEIKVKLEQVGHNALITVSDSGAGIKDDVIGRIFERNFSYDPGGAPGDNGMGLFLVKNIISMHGGTIAVGSKEGSGTRVAFTIPVRTDPEAPDYTAENGMDYLSDRFSSIYVEMSDVCGVPAP